MSQSPNQNPQQRKSDKVLSFRGADSRRPFGVTQEDLAEERLYTIEAAKALQALEDKRKAIREAIERGEAVEPGLRTAYLSEEITPKPYSVNPKPYKKLIVA